LHGVDRGGRGERAELGRRAYGGVGRESGRGVEDDALHGTEDGGEIERCIDLGIIGHVAEHRGYGVLAGCGFDLSGDEVEEILAPSEQQHVVESKDERQHATKAGRPRDTTSCS
jgi:hypothetical protein